MDDNVISSLLSTFTPDDWFLIARAAGRLVVDVLTRPRRRRRDEPNPTRTEALTEDTVPPKR